MSIRPEVQIIHTRALVISDRFKRSQVELIEILKEIDELKGYRDYDQPTLHSYAQKILNLSEDVAGILIGIARKSKEVPALQTLLKEEKITVSNARMIGPILTKANQTEWLTKASNLTRSKLQKEIVKAFPERAIKESVRPISDGHYALQTGMSEQLKTKLQRVQEILTQQRKRPVTLEESIEAMSDFFIEKKDPVIKAQRILVKKLPAPEQATKALPKHEVFLKFNGQCAYMDSQKIRCQERKWLDIHHIQPKSKGGSDKIENLILLCKGHHQLEQWS